MSANAEAMGVFERVAHSLVSRARAGDQNAMAMIERVGAAARRPNASLKSRVAEKMIRAAIAGESPARFGEDARPPCPADLFRNAREPGALAMVGECAVKYRHAGPALVALFAAGPRLTRDKLAAYAKALQALGAGSPVARFLDRVLMRAQATQRVRETNAPVALLSEAAAWEFGA